MTTVKSGSEKKKMISPKKNSIKQMINIMISPKPKGLACIWEKWIKLSKIEITSIQNSPVSGSFATVAVKPAAEEDFPDV